MFADEASFWLDGSLHRTWARVGVQPHVDTYGMQQVAKEPGLDIAVRRQWSVCASGPGRGRLVAVAVAVLGRGRLVAVAVDWSRSIGRGRR